MSNATPRKGLRRQTGLALFASIIVVLQVLSNFVRFGPFPITLALAPIIIELRCTEALPEHCSAEYSEQ